MSSTISRRRLGSISRRCAARSLFSSASATWPRLVGSSGKWIPKSQSSISVNGVTGAMAIFSNFPSAVVVTPLAVLLRLELDGDPDLAEVVDGQIVVAPPGRAEARPVIGGRREALRIAGFGQEPLRFGQIVADQIFRLGRVHLHEVELPLLQGTGYGAGVETAFAVQ